MLQDPQVLGNDHNKPCLVIYLIKYCLNQKLYEFYGIDNFVLIT